MNTGLLALDVSGWRFHALAKDEANTVVVCFFACLLASLWWFCGVAYVLYGPIWARFLSFVLASWSVPGRLLPARVMSCVVRAEYSLAL